MTSRENSTDKPAEAESQARDNRSNEKRAFDPELTPAELDFPDGGMQGWMTVIGGYVDAASRSTLCHVGLLKRASLRFLVLFCTAGLIQSFGVFQDYYTVGDHIVHLFHCILADDFPRFGLFAP